MFLAGLKPRRRGGAPIALGESGTRLLAVERRVGRGRVTMLAFNPTDPAIAAWPGFDTFLRRVILRRPEESLASRSPWNGEGFAPPAFGPLPGPDLSWVRYLARDLGGQIERRAGRGRPERDRPGCRSTRWPALGTRQFPPGPARLVGSAERARSPPEVSVADWNDASLLPRACREALEEASGIKIPHADVRAQGDPRLHRDARAPELAHLPLPVPAAASWPGSSCPCSRWPSPSAWNVAAAYDMGYDTACDEIDLLEAFGDYPRAHLSRFASLYSTGRTPFSVTYPDEPTALILPLDNGRSLRGEDVCTTVFQSFPVPGLMGFTVQPRSLSIFRAEQMAHARRRRLPGHRGRAGRVVNGSGPHLRERCSSTWTTPGGERPPAPGLPGYDPAGRNGRDQARTGARAEPREAGRPRAVVAAGPASRRAGRTGPRTPARSAWWPGSTARRAARRSSRPSTATAGSRRSSSTSAMAPPCAEGPIYFARTADLGPPPAVPPSMPKKRVAPRLARPAPRPARRVTPAPGLHPRSRERLPMIEVINFTKRYGDFVAVDDLSFTINQGEVFGFIGPNGAGKSTTIRFLATLLRPTSGEGRVAGHSVVTDPMAVRRVIGFMPDDFGVYDGMKVWEFLDFFAVAYEIPLAYRKKIINEVLELLELTHKRDDYVNGLSKGMKQRLCLAKTLVHDPPVLILDEPASGLDPRAGSR